MKNYIFKETPKVIIRSITDQDMPLLYYWRSIKENAQWFFTRDISYSEHVKWFFDNLKDENDYVFMALDVDRQTPIGMVSIYNIDNKHDKAKFGRLLVAHPDYIGRGYGKEIAKVAINIAFSTLNLEELTLEVMRDNFIAYSLYASLGFKRVLFDEDMTLMRLNKHDWK